MTHSILFLCGCQVVTDEVSMSESTRQVLQVERRIEGGCKHLLDSEQALVRKGLSVGPFSFDIKLHCTFLHSSCRSLLHSFLQFFFP